jgi:hypothetical protein
MNRSEVELVLDRYLSDGPERVPDRVIDAALDTIDDTQQRRAMRVPWRFNDMGSTLKVAVAGAAIVAVLAVGAVYLGGSKPTANVGGPGPTPSPSAPSITPESPSPSASIALTDTSNWVSFRSPRYWYDIAHPQSWTATPADRDWTMQTDRIDNITSAADHFIDPNAGYQILVTAWMAEVPSGMSDDEWIAAYYKKLTPEQATALDLPQECIDATPVVQPITVDRHRGDLYVSDPCSDAQAFVFYGGHVHVFAVWRDGQTELLQSFLSTVRFRPVRG